VFLVGDPDCGSSFPNPPLSWANPVSSFSSDPIRNLSKPGEALIPLLDPPLRRTFVLGFFGSFSFVLFEFVFSPLRTVNGGAFRS